MDVTHAAVAVGVVAVVLVFLDIVSGRVSQPRPRKPTRDVAELSIRHEDVRIPAGDHSLAGWILCPEGREGRPLVLLAHGWGANYSRLLSLAGPLVEAGCPVLLFDIQGHGRNEPVAYVTARHFRDDILAVTRYAAERFPHRRRILVGHSMGGGAAVLAAAAGAPVDALVLIAAPANVLDVTADYLRDRGLPGGLMVALLHPFWWRRIGGFFRHIQPERRIKEVSQPLVILQPELDERVSASHARRLGDAAGVEPVVIPGANHNDVLENPETHRILLEVAERETRR
ncbi:MAG: alpha/beta hydrolase [Gemmatimonadota bacterium]